MRTYSAKQREILKVQITLKEMRDHWCQPEKKGKSKHMDCLL
jgi:hypothetical protein